MAKHVVDQVISDKDVDQVNNIHYQLKTDDSAQ